MNGGFRPVRVVALGWVTTSNKALSAQPASYDGTPHQPLVPIYNSGGWGEYEYAQAPLGHKNNSAAVMAAEEEED